MPRYLSLNEKVKLIELYARGNSVVEIAFIVKRDPKTIRLWIRRWLNGSIESLPRSGRKQALTESQQVKLLAAVQRKQVWSAVDLKKELCFTCHVRTIRNYLYLNGVHCFKAPKRPTHFPHHLAARKTFAEILKKLWKAKDWKNVIFTDESTFYNHRSCSRNIWRRKNVEAPVNACQSNATSRIKVNVWAGISSTGFVSIRLVLNILKNTANRRKSY